MKAVLSCAVLALLATPALAQRVGTYPGDVYSNQTRGGTQRPPNEQLDPQGHYNYMIAQGACPDNPGQLHTAWHTCGPNDRQMRGLPPQKQPPTFKVVPVLQGMLRQRYVPSNEWARRNNVPIFDPGGVPQSNVGSQPRNTTRTTGRGATRAPMPRRGDRRPTSGNGFDNGTSYYPDGAGPGANY